MAEIDPALARSAMRATCGDQQWNRLAVTRGGHQFRSLDLAAIHAALSFLAGPSAMLAGAWLMNSSAAIHRS
jgi:hypothetical protein